MKVGEPIKDIKLEAGIQTVLLDQIYPIWRLEGIPYRDLEITADGVKSEETLEKVTYGDKIQLFVEKKGRLKIILGPGYIAKKDPLWTDQFSQKQGWAGGDGIYSFNLTSGNDQFDQTEPATNLFVFGDTLVGRTDPLTKKRFGPLIMVNNSLAYLDKQTDQVKFHLNQNQEGSIISYFTIDPESDFNGTIPENVCLYDQRKANEGWLSGYHPQELWLCFDLQQKTMIDKIAITNYFHLDSSELSSRGVKVFHLFGSDNKKDWTFIGEYELKPSYSFSDQTVIVPNQSFRYFKFDINPRPGIGNYDDDAHEGLFGLRQVRFFSRDRWIRDIHADASSILLKEPAHAHIWLQDGVIIQDHLYFFPYLVVTDLDQPEGLQFAIKGISMIKVPIREERIVPKEATQKKTPFCAFHNGSDYTFGGAIMAHTLQSGIPNPDGYIYIYGYKTTMGLRQMIAGRVKPDDIEFFDAWEFFDGEEWQWDFLKSAPLIDHISTEFSVSRVQEGLFKGKYLAVFTYDTNTPKIAFAFGDSPVGKFSTPQVIYHKPEPEMLGKTTYAYNAKAHPQLSKSVDVLVSYNVNTYSFAHNMENADVYSPRFIRLKDTTTL
ncbi:MAG: hypothetical protein PHP61_02205 [Candidatus Izemoplasmatales bacterium]|nr:hypothetical protein [Candidatus Izemoplasmatales bacterium]